MNEGLGSIEEWASLNGHSLTSTKFFMNGSLPDISDLDWLIIMGGPMNVNDEEQFPWLAGEKRFIRQAIDSGKYVLGICLGSQLVSSALGAKVYPNKEREIGWFDIEFSPSAQSDSLFSDNRSRIKVFHWHGDTFDLPEGAIHLAMSEGCRNQAYAYKKNVLALQFHLEPTLELLVGMIQRGKEELIPGKYIQSEADILNNKQLLETNKNILFAVLDKLAGQQS